MMRIRLHTKFLVLVLGSLIAVLGALSYVIIQREAGLLTRKGLEKQHAVAFAIVSNLQDNMIEGRPRKTLSLMQHLRGTSGLTRLEVLRRDGSPAFGVPGKAVTAPQLAQVFATGEELDFLENGEPPVSTIIIPLKKTDICGACHTGPGRILGAVMISLSREDTLRELARSKRSLITLFSFILMLIGSLLYFVIRKVILQPLSALHEGAEGLGKDGFSRRIKLNTDDELEDLALAFNGMAERIEESYTGLECKVSERTMQLRHAMEEVQDKAERLYKYSRDMATISRLSTKVFNADLSLDELLDRFLWEVTRGLRYAQAMLCLVDRQQVSLDVKRDTGLGGLLPYTSQSLLSDDPLVRLVRAGKVAVLESAPETHDGQGVAPAFLVIPLLNRIHTKACWQITSCIKTDCPAYLNQDTPCWLIRDTHCGNPLMECFENKLAYCVTCPVFPVIGVLIVQAEPQARPLRNKAVSVLRILAAEMAAALENHRLHEENQQMVRDLLELHRVTAAALSELSVQKALGVFAETAMKFSGTGACAFWLLSSGGRELVRRAGGCSDDKNIEDLCPDRLPADEGLVGRAFRGRGNFMIDYNVALNDTTPLNKVAAVYGLNSLLAVPLKGEGGSFGVFTVHKRSDTPFLETDIAACMLLASQAAMAANVCILSDELKTQNLELARHTNLLSGILSSMSSGVMLLDKTGTVMLINQAGASLLRSRREDLADRRLTDIYPETAAFVQSQTGPYQELELTLPDAKTVPIGFSSNHYYGAAGEQQGVIVVFRDLSEVKTLQVELLQKERFAAMGRVVSGVAHEIRNPLFGISAVGQIFTRELKSPAHQELAQALVSETRRMNQLVEDLLLYSRPTKLNPEWCDLLGLWKEVIVLHREELDRKGISLCGDLEHSHREAYLDANQIRQIFLNLLRNSIDATPPGGAIRIKVLLDDRYNVFKVMDTGRGIPSANMDKIFDLFFTTKQKGTGLGLGICKKIAQDHGGDIIVESSEGKGTTVTVKLPYRSIPKKQGAAV